MSRVHWESLGGSILNCKMLSREQYDNSRSINTYHQYINNGVYGIVSLTIDNILLVSGTLLIKNIAIMMSNNQLIDYNHDKDNYVLSLDISNIINTPNAIVPIYISITEEDIIYITKEKANSGFIDIPKFVKKLQLTINPVADSVLLGNIYINKFATFELSHGTYYKCPDKLYDAIEDMNKNLYQYLLYIKSNVEYHDKLPILNLIYRFGLNCMELYEVNKIWLELNNIYSILIGLSGQVLSPIKYGKNNIELSLALISNINNIISIQSKCEMSLFVREETCYVVNINNSNGIIEIILEPGDDNNKNLLWAKNEMRIVSKSKLDEARKLRNIGIERTIVSYDKSMIVMQLKTPDEWFMPNEQLCIDFPIDMSHIILKNIRLRTQRYAG